MLLADTVDTVFQYKNIGILETLKKNSKHKLYLIHATGLFPYSLKTWENFWFCYVFTLSKKKPVAWKGLTDSLLTH